MDVFSYLLGFFSTYTPIVSFLGGIFGGEETLVLLSIYAAKGSLNLWHVISFFYLGILTADTFWYLVGKSKFFGLLMRIKSLAYAYGHWGRLLDHATDKNDFQALFVTKFLYGFRLPTIMYLARERLEFLTFLKFSVVTNFVWAGTIFAISLAAGKGIETATYFSHSIVLELFLIGLTLVTFLLLFRFLSKKTKIWIQKK